MKYTKLVIKKGVVKVNKKLGAFRITPKLRQWLELKEWTQEQLAGKLNVHPSLISQWASPTRPKKPSWKNLEDLINITGLGVEDLLTYDTTVQQG